MFGKDKAGSANGKGSARRGSFSILGGDVTVTGNLAAADLHLDGRIDGDVTCGALVLGAEGRIAGSVTADSARIAGAIEGAVSARELTVERTARIIGDISYEAITIEPGAKVDGQLRRTSRESDDTLTIEARPEDPLRLIDAQGQTA